VIHIALDQSGQSSSYSCPANSGQSSKHVATGLEHAKEAAVRTTPEQSNRRKRAQKQNFSSRAQKHVSRRLKHVCPLSRVRMHSWSFEHGDLAFVHELSTRENKDPGKRSGTKLNPPCRVPQVSRTTRENLHNHFFDFMIAPRLARLASGPGINTLYAGAPALPSTSLAPSATTDWSNRQGAQRIL
jgi:hypothetical protein